VSPDWQHVGRLPDDDTNSTWTQGYNVFDLTVRYTTKVINTWRVGGNNPTCIIGLRLRRAILPAPTLEATRHSWERHAQYRHLRRSTSSRTMFNAASKRRLK
jgi:hypothetical protein